MQLPIDIDKTNGVPVYVQLAEQLRLLVHKGVLRAGNPLPTVRSLAVDLRINANTVARVYRTLQVDGMLRLERGVGTFVAQTAQRPVSKRDFQLIDTKVRQLIRLGRRVGMHPRELAQFLETRWKESNDADR